MVRALALALIALAAISCSTPDRLHTSGSKSERPMAAAPVRDDLGVPLYPGAERKALVSNVDESQNRHLNEQYVTSDPAEKVAAFYEADLGFKPTKKGSVIQMVGRTKKGADVLLFIEPDGNATKITVKGILYFSKLN